MQAVEWKYRRKEDKDGVAKREEKRKTTENIRGCGEGGHAKVGVTEEDEGSAQKQTFIFKQKLVFFMCVLTRGLGVYRAANQNGSNSFIDQTEA